MCLQGTNLCVLAKVAVRDIHQEPIGDVSWDNAFALEDRLEPLVSIAGRSDILSSRTSEDLDNSH